MKANDTGINWIAKVEVIMIFRAYSVSFFKSSRDISY
jgi:hypothetical protein